MGKPLYNESIIWSMNQVMEYIQENLNESLTLEQLAQIAFLSKFHFHRIFKMVSSESLTQFIKRLRIEKAASIICGDSQVLLTDIAMSCGFSSPGYFSRIFKEHFDISASEFRYLSMHEKQQFIQIRIKGFTPLKNFPQLEETLEVGIEEIPRMHLAYIRKFYLDLHDEPTIIQKMLFWGDLGSGKREAICPEEFWWGVFLICANFSLESLCDFIFSPN